MKSRSLRPSTAAALVVVAAGCAHVVSLRGGSDGPNLGLEVAADVEAGRGRVKVDVTNHADDAVGIDVDQIRLRDGKGTRYAPLGVEQKFSGGESGTRRVAHGSINIPPGQRQSIELEFEKLPDKDASFSLVVPQLYILGIEGQIALKAVRVTLKVGEHAPLATGDGGFYDPFEE
jgi:hypothetical protein